MGQRSAIEGDSESRSVQLERREPEQSGRVTAAGPPLTAHDAAPGTGACAVPPPPPRLLPPSSTQAGRQRAHPARPPARPPDPPRK
jgi:hypothetical protein